MNRVPENESTMNGFSTWFQMPSNLVVQMNQEIVEDNTNTSNRMSFLTSDIVSLPQQYPERELLQLMPSPPISPISNIQDQSQFLISPSLSDNITELAIKGSYTFDITFEEEKQKPRKSCDFTWSPVLNRLYAQPFKDIPFTFKTSAPCENVEIKAFLKFKSFVDTDLVVERCPTHFRDEAGLATASHVFRCVNPGTEYFQCSKTKRWFLSVKCTFQKPIKNLQFSFGCSTSCKGGINRRKSEVVFILFVRGKIEGFATVDVHVSSCPGRDRQNCEKKFFATDQSQVPQSEPHYPPFQLKQEENDGVDGWKNSLSTSSSNEDEFSKKRHKLITYISISGSGDNNEYELKIPPIRGREKARAFLHFANLVIKADGMKRAMIKQVEEGTSDQEDLASPAKSKSSPKKRNRDVSSVAEDFETLKRSRSDETAYRTRYKKYSAKFSLNL